MVAYPGFIEHAVFERQIGRWSEAYRLDLESSQAHSDL